MRLWPTLHQTIMPLIGQDNNYLDFREDHVDGVEILLRHEEDTHKEGSPYSWEIMDEAVANFTSDIILAAHWSGR
jgi:hypothetical protein